MRKVFYNGQFFTGKEIIDDKVLLTEDERIKGFIDNGSIPGDATLVDCRGLMVTAGLIDLQIAGGGGYLFSSNPTPEALDAITDAIIATGTTGFLLALPTNTKEVFRQAMETVREHPNPALLGLHLEGPYISHARKGAHPAGLIKKPDEEALRSFLDDAGNTIRMMTVAPEVCSENVINIMRERGITVSAGHSNATFKEALNGFEKGIESTTHLFNAMSALNHRNPGLPGAVFISDTARAGIIADGIHVDYAIVTIAKRIMKERLFLVSDAVEENDREPYLHVRRENRYTLPDGTLSGSRLTMLKAVRNCINHAGIDKFEALRMASLYPAQLIKATDRGIIAPGARADLILIDNDMNMRGICFNGNIKLNN